MSVDHDQILIESLRDTISRLEQVNTSKDLQLAAKDAQLLTIQEAGQRKLEHIAHLERERLWTGIADSDPQYNYRKLYKPARCTLLQQNRRNLIETKLAVTMAELNTAKAESQLSQAKQVSCEREVEDLVIWKGKISKNVEDLEHKHHELVDTVDELQATVQGLKKTVGKLKKKESKLTVNIEKMNYNNQNNMYHVSAPSSQASVDGKPKRPTISTTANSTRKRPAEDKDFAPPAKRPDIKAKKPQTRPTHDQSNQTAVMMPVCSTTCFYGRQCANAACAYVHKEQIAAFGLLEIASLPKKPPGSGAGKDVHVNFKNSGKKKK